MAWIKVFATSDQTAMTIIKLFVDQIVCRHGVPAQLLSDRGATFLSHLLMEICELLGVKSWMQQLTIPKQMHWLNVSIELRLISWQRELNEVERIGMLTSLLCFLLTVLVYRSQQKNCLLYLLYGCDPWLPTTLEPDSEQQQHLTDLNTCRVKVAFKFSEAWKLARDIIAISILRKHNSARKSTITIKQDYQGFKVDDQVFLYACCQSMIVRLINL